MFKHVSAYVRVFESHVSPELCDATVAELQSAKWGPNEFYNATLGTYQRWSDAEPSVCRDALSTSERLMKSTWSGIHAYVAEHQKTWFNSWRGFSTPRYNRYEPGQLMAEHCDHIQSLFDGERKGIPILSVVGALDDGYEGGEFVMFGDEVVPLPKGALLLFPSHFLFPHRVEPVTKGVRHTFVSWVW